MRILLTGANGYIGQRLIPVLLQQGHELVCLVRNKVRFAAEHTHPRIQIIEADLSAALSPALLPKELDAAYYLVHSLHTKVDGFESLEIACAKHFLDAIQTTQCRQIIYLSGIVNAEQLSKHLHSRFAVERTLQSGSIPVTVLRAGIIVGSGSASFEIIRDLVEKLPVMITPKWLNTLCQPIAVRNVLGFLTGVLLQSFTFNQAYDIAGPEILTYKQMLLQFAEVRGLKRYIYTIPVMTPRLSSYWLYFITATSYPLAVNLVNSMKVAVVARPNDLAERLQIPLLTYKEAVSLAFQKIEQHEVISSWKDAFSASGMGPEAMQYVQVPRYGCFWDVKLRKIELGDLDKVVNNVWSIGGKRGWYYGNWMWRIRGIMDKLVGGVGLRRGRRDQLEIFPGDALDFWRVLVAEKEPLHLLLFAEMKLPGEAWLEFKIIERNGQQYLRQTATFRPHGVAGRLYWYSVLPFHYFIFNGMINQLVRYRTTPALATGID